jgi:hypothetical protein
MPEGTTSEKLTQIYNLVEGRSVSDDDLCATCRNCDYQPGDLSDCEARWPGMEDADGYVQECEAHDPIQI